VVFDWGGVLIDNPATGLVRHCAKALGVKPETAQKVFRQFEKDFQTGQIGEPELWKQACGELKVKVPDCPSLWKQAVQAVFTPRAEVLDLVRVLKANGYKTGFLSNTEVPTMEYYKEQDYPVFDVTVASCEEGVCKPDARIYDITLQRLGTAAAETVFIDDRPDFIKGAEAVGMKTILYDNLEQVKTKLGQLGIEL